MKDFRSMQSLCRDRGCIGGRSGAATWTRWKVRAKFPAVEPETENTDVPPIANAAIEAISCVDCAVDGL